MIGAVAGQGGLPDISEKTVGVYSARTSSTTNVELCNITGSGYLVGVSQGQLSGSSYDFRLTIIVDGVTIIADDGASSSNGLSVHSLLMKRFNSSLVVYHRCNNASGAVVTRANVALD